MPRTKRNKPHNPARAHDRRSRDLPRNAEVATIEVDNPLALEPGEKIVALRSIRNDPLGRLHSHRQIDEAQYQGGRAFQDDWEQAERGPRAVEGGIIVHGVSCIADRRFIRLLHGGGDSFASGPATQKPRIAHVITGDPLTAPH